MSSIGNTDRSARMRVPSPLPYVHCAESWDEVDVINKRVPLHPTKVENWSDYAKICVKKPLPPIPFVHSVESWDADNADTYDAEANVINRRLILQPPIHKELNKNERRAFRMKERERHARLKKQEDETTTAAAAALVETL